MTTNVLEVTAMTSWVRFWSAELGSAVTQAASSRPLLLMVLLILNVATALIAAFGVHV